MKTNSSKFFPYFAKSILNKVDDSLFSYTLNPYRGCEHGCLYCYVNAKKYSPFDKNEFSRRIYIKTNAVYLLKKELQKGKLPGVVCIGTSTDPYQEVEKIFKITRQILEIFSRFSQPVHIFTKSELILRDIDILKEINRKSRCVVSITIIGVSKKISLIFEKNAPSPSKRFSIIKKLSNEGIRVGIALMPIIPFINEDEVEDIVKEAKAKGADFVIFDFLNLREGHKEDFLLLIKERFPKIYPEFSSLYRNRVSPPGFYTEKTSSKILEIIEKYQLNKEFSSYFSKSIKNYRQEELFR
ncbi:MAG: hypothetical protein DRI36_05810 [Caldiserica bacterium]|nr:MAG: hypothetical protein DRI36_05810 [Caldisericota bacterium]